MFVGLEVKLDIYEGPLDLLLHLIRKNEVDIYDIPIALITRQYLEYLELMESMNMEIAGEFLLMAATLTQIKSKTLLPVLNDDEEMEEEDPRMAIVRPLLEHIRIKEAAEALERRTVLNRDVFVRSLSLDEQGYSDEQGDIVKANLFDLIDAFRKIVTRFTRKSGIEIVVETKTIKERISEIIRLLKKEKQVAFEKLCENDKTRAELILSFLSILELARVAFVNLYQNQTTRELVIFYIEKAEEDSDDEPMLLRNSFEDYNG